MKREPQFTPIDLQTWKRGQMFYYFSKMAPTGYSLTVKLLPPPNAYTVSCVPWISFQHFSVHSFENKPYFFPSVEAGKFIMENGKLMMPLSITCHHAATDGYHVSRFLEQLQTEADEFRGKVL